MADTAAPLPTDRAALLERLAEPRRWDLCVVGGGATGLGIAVDAAARGLSVVLLDSGDFAGGTSSRATKLVHGGVRYLAQGNVALVREALHERATLLANAPHLAQPLPFVMPAYRLLEAGFYGTGLKVYDALAGTRSLGPTQLLGRDAVLARMPGAQPQGLRAGVQYWDAQFDDARLAIALARTAAAHGALLVNHCAAMALVHVGGRVAGVRWRDGESGREGALQAGCVVNATGVWVDRLREADAAATGASAAPLVTPSQGVHLVVDADFFPGQHALLVPKTADGRVLFAVPWLGKVVLGTTDTPRPDAPREPEPFQAEIDFILREATRYLRRAPTRADVRSCWVGLRPLARPAEGAATGATKTVSREHTVQRAGSGLVSVTGGKWTTYRAMAEDVLAECMEAGLLARRPAGATQALRLAGAPATPPRHRIAEPPGAHLYGSDAAALDALPGAGREVAPGLSEAMVRFAVRHEYARTVEDVLARRSRLLFLDAEAARAAAPRVAELLREEGIAQPGLAAFEALAGQYAKVAQGG